MDSYTASTQSYDTLDDLMSRFTLEYKPEYSLKLRNRCVTAAASRSLISGRQAHPALRHLPPLRRTGWGLPWSASTGRTAPTIAKTAARWW